MSAESVPEDATAAVARFRSDLDRLTREIGQRLVGQREIVEGVVAALLAGGHVLLEGVPGLGKTLLVKTLGEALELSFSRIQFTPDLMPADVVGTNMIVESGPQGARRFEFQPGPIFANLILADEINRATPKTQSALLEAMQEQSVTVSKQTYALAPPFFVLATQNPIEMEGIVPAARRRSSIAFSSSCASRCRTTPTCTRSSTARRARSIPSCAPCSGARACSSCG